MLVLCLLVFIYITYEKQSGFYQNKVTQALLPIQGQVTKHTTVKWPVLEFNQSSLRDGDWQSVTLMNATCQDYQNPSFRINSRLISTSD